MNITEKPRTFTVDFSEEEMRDMLGIIEDAIEYRQDHNYPAENIEKLAEMRLEIKEIFWTD